MTDAVKDLKAALRDVPLLLLGDDLTAVLDDAIAATDALEVFVPNPSFVVILGPSGAGKSSVVNALVGFDVVAVSPIRPTTNGVTAIGGGGPTALDGTTEYVVTDKLAAGLVVVDTPAWDGSDATVAPLVAGAALAIVVTTPSRYGDEQTRVAIEAATTADRWELVANRLPQAGAEQEQILDAMHERLGVAPIATFAEGDAIVLDEILGSVPLDDSAAARQRVLLSAAAGASRRVAEGLKQSAVELGLLEVAIENAPRQSFDTLALDDAVDWGHAREALVEASNEAVASWDAEVLSRCSNRLASRVAEALEDEDDDAMRVRLDAWREDTQQRFRRRSSIWFRKASGIALLDRWSWIMAVNPDEPIPRRVRRMMKDSLESTARKSRADLVAIVGEPAGGLAWSGLINEAGQYRPGVLLAAADHVDPTGVSDA